MSITAMKQALEALKAARHGHCDHAWADEAIADLDAAIEQAEKQEPVVCKHEWFSTGAMGPGECRCIKCGIWNTTLPAQPASVQFKCTVVEDQHPAGVPLEQWGTAAQRTWVGLTDEDKAMCIQATIERGSADELIAAIEAKLKEKNT